VKFIVEVDRFWEEKIIIPCYPVPPSLAIWNQQAVSFSFHMEEPEAAVVNSCKHLP
jgi:hypothetical protein